MPVNAAPGNPQQTSLRDYAHESSSNSLAGLYSATSSSLATPKDATSDLGSLVAYSTSEGNNNPSQPLEHANSAAGTNVVYEAAQSIVVAQPTVHDTTTLAAPAALEHSASQTSPTAIVTYAASNQSTTASGEMTSHVTQAALQVNGAAKASVGYGLMMAIVLVVL